MSNPSDILIDVEDVSYDYESNDQAFPVLKNVSFKIKRGEMLAIQGSSGSGKSTLLYLLGLMMPIKHGKIFFDQLTPSDLNDERRAKIRNTRIGFVFQQFHLLPRTSVLDNILLPLSYQNSEVSSGDKQKAKLLAAQLGITELLTKHPNHLSGGQQQRVAICRALINNAELILADEPTGNLDPTNATQILDIFRRLSHDEGKTIVIITHDLQIAQKCDRILNLANGKLLESPTDKVHSRPRVPTLKVLEEKRTVSSSLQKFWQTFMEHIPLSIANIQRNRLRSWLTMIGVSVGIASVLAMMTLGGFARDQILEQFFENGANTFDIRTFFSSSQKASDRNLQTFQGIDAAIEIPTLKNILPDIQSISPVRTIWNARVSSVGTKSDTIESDVGIKGSDPSLLQTGLMRLDEGRFLIDDDLRYARPVCVVGQKIAQQLLLPVNRIGQYLTINTNRDSFICKVIGIFSKSSKQIVNSSLDTVILMPESFVA
ncbi:MAG TPA: ATP-binding cassette domain-containing protein, partial [Pseudobdellovibrionaceae bacterium]|nr:ATP-binding cassette domain-containing protein [Pseudobdellovibrionaceae bacterium]